MSSTDSAFSLDPQETALLGSAVDLTKLQWDAAREILEAMGASASDVGVIAATAQIIATNYQSNVIKAGADWHG